MSASVKTWLGAFRLRTLPLSFSVIFMGTFIAAAEHHFNGWIFGLALLTTLFLQILSNLANDYGDTQNGADGDDRVGPARAVQSGAITMPAMKKAIAITGTLALVTGLALIYIALKDLNPYYLGGFFLLGIACIIAAIKYTAGSNPYGYKGWGDFFVLFFFGWVGVMGTYFLYTDQFDPVLLLPATAMGLLSTGVLNVNNMRDHIPDQKAGKITVVVRLGFMSAKIYHIALIGLAFVCAIAYMAINYHSPWQWLFLVTLPLFVRHITVVLQTQEAQLLDPQLKVLALSTLVFCLTFGGGLLLSMVD